MPHIGYSGRSPCYSVAVRPHVHMAYGAPEVSDAEAPIARVLAWAITNGAGPQREGLRGSAELTGRAELGLGAGLGQQVPDGLIVHLDLRHRTQCSGHDAHDTVAKVRPRGIDQWRIRGV